MAMHFQNEPDLNRFRLGLPVLDLSGFDPFRRNNSPPTEDLSKIVRGLHSRVLVQYQANTGVTTDNVIGTDNVITTDSVIRLSPIM